MLFLPGVSKDGVDKFVIFHEMVELDNDKKLSEMDYSPSFACELRLKDQPNYVIIEFRYGKERNLVYFVENINSKIVSLREKLYEYCGIEPEAQLLRFKNKILTNDMTVKSSDLTMFSSVDVIPLPVETFVLFVHWQPAKVLKVIQLLASFKDKVYNAKEVVKNDWGISLLDQTMVFEGEILTDMQKLLDLKKEDKLILHLFSNKENFYLQVINKITKEKMNITLNILSKLKKLKQIICIEEACDKLAIQIYYHEEELKDDEKQLLNYKIKKDDSVEFLMRL